jgi:16S rRNA G966 N2-methylase RsmD
VDPFAGSGMSGIAAIEVGRDCVLIDNNEEYTKLAFENIKNAQKEITVELIKYNSDNYQKFPLLESLLEQHRQKREKFYKTQLMHQPVTSAGR